MPSNAFTQHLLALLEDADELVDVHGQMRTGLPGRQWGLGALNRAVVVMSVSAWEAYIEEVIIEAITAIRPAAGNALGNWPALNASARSAIGRFNNPNVENVRMLISHSIGLPDITASWYWRNCTVAPRPRTAGRSTEFETPDRTWYQSQAGRAQSVCNLAAQVPPTAWEQYRCRHP